MQSKPVGFCSDMDSSIHGSSNSLDNQQSQPALSHRAARNFVNLLCCRPTPTRRCCEQRYPRTWQKRLRGGSGRGSGRGLRHLRTFSEIASDGWLQVLYSNLRKKLNKRTLKRSQLFGRRGQNIMEYMKGVQQHNKWRRLNT